MEISKQLAEELDNLIGGYIGLVEGAPIDLMIRALALLDPRHPDLKGNSARTSAAIFLARAQKASP